MSEGASNYFSSLLGDVLGVIIAACIVFFLAPVHRWAEWLSTALVNPEMQEPEYETYRRFQLYRAAVEEALALGELNDGQKALLNRLRESFHITEEDAMHLEEDLLHQDSLAV